MSSKRYILKTTSHCTWNNLSKILRTPCRMNAGLRVCKRGKERYEYAIVGWEKPAEEDEDR